MVVIQLPPTEVRRRAEQSLRDKQSQPPQGRANPPRQLAGAPPLRLSKPMQRKIPTGGPRIRAQPTGGILAKSTTRTSPKMSRNVLTKTPFASGWQYYNREATRVDHEFSRLSYSLELLADSYKNPDETMVMAWPVYGACSLRAQVVSPTQTFASIARNVNQSQQVYGAVPDPQVSVNNSARTRAVVLHASLQVTIEAGPTARGHLVIGELGAGTDELITADFRLTMIADMNRVKRIPLKPGVNTYMVDFGLLSPDRVDSWEAYRQGYYKATTAADEFDYNSPVHGGLCFINESVTWATTGDSAPRFTFLLHNVIQSELSYDLNHLASNYPVRPAHKSPAGGLSTIKVLPGVQTNPDLSKAGYMLRGTGRK